MRHLLVVAVVTLFAVVPVLADGPIPGIYHDVDFGGQMLKGRFTESWYGPSFRDGELHNTLHAESWNNQFLGTQWQVYCASLAQVTLDSDNRVNGTGDVVWDTDYVGGTLWLSKTGPWGDNTLDYTATIDQFRVLSTHSYVGGTRVAVVSNVTFSGHFDDPVESCFEYSIANVAIQGFSPMPIPAGYPSLLDYDNCPGGTLTQGAWGPATQITLVITGSCTVPVEESTWGEVKSLYED